MLNNEDFLRALFGEDYQWSHVTDFTRDPDHIPAGKDQLMAWRGNYFSRYRFTSPSNQYFTISTFYADDQGHARRRKSLFRATHVIVLDDVKEKLSLQQVSKLPEPSWIMETSPGSEQWGYILTEPCEDRARVDNLLDGLVQNGLAPDGKDPGMKGVTRYVRLPEGYNLKAKKAVNGKPFKCRVTQWAPWNTVTLEDLAIPFTVNLDAVRRDQRVDGAARVDDHPLLNLHDIIHIKEVRSDGRFDITCPWVDEHSDALDSGSAVFTNADGTIGFKCHHGSCQDRTGRDLLQLVEQHSPGFGQAFNTWKIGRAFGSLPQIQANADARGSGPGTPANNPPTAHTAEAQTLDDVMAQLRRLPFSTPQARELASKILQFADSMPAMDKQHWQEEVRAYMQWSKLDFKSILKSLRSEWYKGEVKKLSFFDDVIFVGEINQFYDVNKNIFYSAEAYQNVYSHLSPDARKDALQGGMVMKVDKIDYAPMKPAIFTEGHIRYGNSWSQITELSGIEGDIEPYLHHFEVVHWGAYRRHIMQYAAHTILHPDQKINHMLILGSGEGAGKDFILTPLIRALGENSRTIEGNELLDKHNEYVFRCKHLHINEVELGDHNDARMIASRLKPMTAAPPHTLRVNPKGFRQFSVRNVLSVTMTTNSPVPLNFKSPTRRAYALWTDFTTRDENEETSQRWIDYWGRMWEWMDNGGAEAVIYYLRNYVNLADFNAGAPPPMTEFLREIRAASESPAQQTVRHFIEHKVGAFAADLATAAELVETLRGGQFLAPGLCVVNDMAWFTPVKLGIILRELAIPMYRVNDGARSNKVYVLRNRRIYETMGTADLYAHYELQRDQALHSRKLRAVK